MAIAELQEALRLKKDYPEAYLNLGSAFTLRGNGHLDKAIAAFQEVIRLKDYPEAHHNMGLLLLQQGRFTDALIALKRANELGSKNPRWNRPSAQLVRQAEQLVALEGKLPKLLKGEAQPADVDERLAIAQMCQEHKGLYCAAFQFYLDAFAEQPKLAEDLQRQLRYNAACAAALAACGQGKDADKLDDKERARLRHQAIDWLRAELAAWRPLLEKEPDKVRPVVLQTMRHWQQDKDFAGVRGKEALGKLPEDECGRWEKLWQEVAALKERAAQK